VRDWESAESRDAAVAQQELNYVATARTSPARERRKIAASQRAQPAWLSAERPYGTTHDFVHCLFAGKEGAGENGDKHTRTTAEHSNESDLA
jgi:hypothetical protein